jgi:hypothetical protein
LQHPSRHLHTRRPQNLHSHLFLSCQYTPLLKKPAHVFFFDTLERLLNLIKHVILVKAQIILNYLNLYVVIYINVKSYLQPPSLFTINTVNLSLRCVCKKSHAQKILTSKI